MDLLQQIQARGAVKTTVCVGATGAGCSYELHCGAFDEIADAYRPAVDVIFSQMLGLFTAIELGIRPDTPSPNGLISRVVEQFEIHV